MVKQGVATGILSCVKPFTVTTTEILALPNTMISNGRRAKKGPQYRQLFVEVGLLKLSIYLTEVYFNGCLQAVHYARMVIVLEIFSPPKMDSARNPVGNLRMWIAVREDRGKDIPKMS